MPKYKVSVYSVRYKCSNASNVFFFSTGVRQSVCTVNRREGKRKCVCMAFLFAALGNKFWIK